MTLTADVSTITFKLNGEEVSVGAQHPHVLAALRDELGITSAKDGCAPSGQCGCCTVLADGKALVSCVTDVDKLAGKDVTTLEGFEPAERDRLARAFAATGALQCGFCTPGIVVRTKALIDQNIFTRMRNAVICIAPPLTTDETTLDELVAGVRNAIVEVFGD